MRARAWWFFAFAAAAAVCAHAVERPLARVGGEPVDARELREEFIRRHGGHARFLGGESEIRAFLEQVIDRRLLLQEAYRLELDRLPEIREAAEKYAENRAVAWLIEHETTRRAEPTEEEMHAAWERHTTTLYRVLQLVVATREEAAAATAELAAGAEFELLARERSTARSRLAGGLLPSVGWGAMSAEWEAIVFALEPGQTSAPFRGEDGWEIVRMVEKIPVERPDYGRAKAKIQGILRRRQLEARRAELQEELWARYQARRNELLEASPAELAALAKSAPGTTLASWKGGSLELGTFAGGLDLEAVAALPPVRAERELEQLVDRSVNYELVRLEVAAKGVAQEPDVAAEVRTYQETLMEGALYADYLLRGVTVDEAEERSWFEAHAEDFATPERRHVAHLVATTPEAARELAARLARGEDFETLVRAESSDLQTRDKGGDLGWVTRRETPSGFEPVFELGEGEVSAPLESKYGWHLVRVVEIEPERPRPFEEVEPEVRELLLERKKTERRREWVAQLREATEIEIDDAAIAELAAESAAAAAEPPPSH